MTDENAGTPEGGDEAQDASATAADAKTGTQTPDEVTTLRSRNQGLDAKVTTLTQAQKAEKARADAAEQKLRDYEANKVGADEALRAQLAVKEDELKAARQEAALARIESQFPETYAVLGEAAFGLSAEKLAEAEARFKGVAAPDAPAANPKPIGNNAGRTIEAPREETSDDILRKLMTMPIPE